MIVLVAFMVFHPTDSLAQTPAETVTETIEGYWTAPSFETPEEAEAWVREYDNLYVEHPALEYGNDNDLKLVSQRLIRVEIKRTPGADYYPFRARAIVEATLSPWPWDKEDDPDKSEDISAPSTEPDPFSAASEAAEMDSIMESDVARQAAEAMLEATDEVLAAQVGLTGVLEELYADAVASGAQDVIGAFDSHMVELRKSIERVRRVKEMVNSMQETAWGGVESLFAGLLAELQALETSPSGRILHGIAHDATYPRARDDLIRSVNRAKGEAEAALADVARERNLREIRAQTTDATNARQEGAADLAASGETAQTDPETKAASEEERAAGEEGQAEAGRRVASKPPARSADLSGSDDLGPGEHSMDSETAATPEEDTDEETAEDSTVRHYSPEIKAARAAQIARTENKDIRLSLRENRTKYFEGEFARADAAIEKAKAGKTPSYVTIYKPRLTNPERVEQCREEYRSTKNGMDFPCNRRNRILDPSLQSTRDLMRRECSDFMASRYFDPSWFDVPIRQPKKNAGLQFPTGTELMIDWAIESYEAELVARRMGLPVDTLPAYSGNFCSLVGEYENVLLVESVGVDASAISREDIETSLRNHFGAKVEDANIIIREEPGLYQPEANATWVRDPGQLAFDAVPLELWPTSEMQDIMAQMKAMQNVLAEERESFEELPSDDASAALEGRIGERIAALEPPRIDLTNLPNRPTAPKSSASIAAKPSAATQTTGIDHAKVQPSATPDTSDELFDDFWGTNSAPATEPAAPAQPAASSDDLFDDFWD